MADLSKNIEKLYALMSPCRLCPHECGALRFEGEKGKCRAAGRGAMVSSYNLHFGEEPPVSGTMGSGTIFFTNCNLRCAFCQNYPISQLGNGKPAGPDELAAMMLELQQNGAQNINFVTPTHVLPVAADAVLRARKSGLTLPIVYNCGGYESVEALKLLEGIIDVYLPDAKYSDDKNAVKYSGAPGYWEADKAALKEMYRQAGNLRTDKDGAAIKGMIIRHLVLPNGISGSEKVLRFIAEELSPEMRVSIMAQYHPANRSGKYPELSRKVSAKEYGKVVDLAEELGLVNSWIQEL